MAPPPPVAPNPTNAIPGLIGISILFAVALISFAVRIYTRIRPTVRLLAGDYVITAAVLCEIIVLTCLFTAIGLGFGHTDSLIPPDTLISILKSFFALGLFGFWASSLARISIGNMLLRFDVSKTWRVALWILIAVQIAMPVGANIFQLAQCRPVRAMWEPVTGAKCWNTQVSQSYGYVYSGMGITSDFIFAIMPLYFIWSLNRPVLERILICILMALGIVAAGAGIMKAYYIHWWDPRKNTPRDWMPLFWWYRAEELVLITAACAPFMKAPVQRLLGKCGIERFNPLEAGADLERTHTATVTEEFHFDSKATV